MTQKLKAWCNVCNDIATIGCLEDWAHSEQVESWDDLDDKTMELFELVGKRVYAYTDCHYTILGEPIYRIRYD